VSPHVPPSPRPLPGATTPPPSTATRAHTAAQPAQRPTFTPLTDHALYLADLADEMAQILRQIAQDAANPLAGSPNECVHGSNVEPLPTLPPKLLSVDDMADLLQVNQRTIRRWRMQGRLPSGIEIAGVIRWHPDEIDEWIRDGGVA